ncbi:glycosyltransferase [Brevibacterium sp. R8603A2]|uniref:glycosyltransferase n=1 Tax=Brevibacterium sp. R8603A2 TaxID=2929779 RepID=UPI001FF8D70C|nr:glycosyltransferase [Brevibacterium sp. R8603A2]
MRIAVLSLHTSPAAQPGQGDAGGMNVYVRATAAELARAGHTVEIFTADPLAPTTGTVELAPGVRLHQLDTSARDKTALADDVPALAAALAAHPAYAGCELIWAHYWISALAGLALTEHPTPAPTPGPRLVVSFHTIAAVKDRDTGAALEPAQRRQAEERIAAGADLLVANTEAEAADMVDLLGADPARVVTAMPGVDLATFTPGPLHTARRAVGEQDADLLLLYVGRMQHVKGTDTAVEALAALARLDPMLAARTRLVMLGAASGEGTDPAAVSARIDAAGLHGRVEILPPVPAAVLADWYRAVDLVLVPSRSESFGFAAAEAQACGAPVVASAVGGLTHVVEAGRTGLLIAEDDPLTWAEGIEALLCDPAARARMGAAAAQRAREFDWRTCAATVLAAVPAAPDALPGTAEARGGGPR